MKASILFISYNHGRFAAEAIRAAMAQDYTDLELVVCDDASTDNTYSVVEEELKHCPSHITVVRAHSKKNVGLIPNFNQGMAACSGEVIIPMAGDDVSLPNRVSRIMEEFTSSPGCMLVYSNWIRIDDEGHGIPGTCRHCEDKTFAHSPRPTCVYAGGKGPGATAAYRAQIFKTFGFLDACRRPEDRCYWVRALLLGDVHYMAEPLVKWRTHGGNWSNYQGGADTAAARDRILKELLCRQNYGRQFRKDIDHAFLKSLVSQPLANRLFSIIAEDRERERLRRFSLSNAPWRLWFGAAGRLIMTSPTFGNLSRILRSDLSIRMNSRRRERHWKRKIKKG